MNARQVPLPFALAPYSDPDTSRTAAKMMEPHLDAVRARILEAIREAGPAGVCDHELEARLGGLHQTVSAARRGLEDFGFVGIDREEEYVAIAAGRCRPAHAQTSLFGPPEA